jgi:hypothetical protein
MKKDWTIREVYEVLKQGAINLAELDEKDPFALLNDGSGKETWTAYVHSVQRTFAALDPYFTAVGLSAFCQPKALDTTTESL